MSETVYLLGVLVLAMVALAAVVIAERARPRMQDHEPPAAPIAPPGEVPRRRAVDMSQEIAAAFDRVLGLAQRHGVRLESAVMPGVTMRTDPMVLRNVLMETIAGAIRAADGGRVLVAVFLDPEATEITVTDDGPVRADSLREVELRVVAAILDLHGGTVMLDARPNRGTVVTLRLPIEINEATARPSEPARNRVRTTTPC
ncbi:MAG: sensor histidine kinase [Acetobacteraceae bacterium]